MVAQRIVKTGGNRQGTYHGAGLRAAPTRQTRGGNALRYREKYRC
jgi:hypothetical protein